MEGQPRPSKYIVGSTCSNRPMCSRGFEYLFTTFRNSKVQVAFIDARFRCFVGATRLDSKEVAMGLRAMFSAAWQRNNSRRAEVVFFAWRDVLAS